MAKTFHFEYTVAPAECNNDFWIDIRKQHMNIECETLKDAYHIFADRLRDAWSVDIKQNGIKTAKAMYVDSKEGTPIQVGLVFTAHTEIEFDYYQWKHRVVEVWTTITESVTPDFKAA